MAESLTDQNPGVTTGDPDESWVPWKNRLAASRRMRDDRSSIWQQNVEKRKAGKGAESTEQGVSVNKDWPLTKAKIATLYSQTPEVRLSPKQDLFKPVVPLFGKVLNDTIKEANVGATIQEELADTVNASGIGACLTSCETKSELRFSEILMADVPQVVDIQYLCTRISPTDLLIPTDFTGSDYDQARWLGHEGRMPWAQAKAVFGLTEAQKDDVVGADKRASGARTSLNTDTNKYRDTEVVNYQELFYWRHFYHEEETRFKALQRIVFVDGLDAPVINEEYRGQKRMPDGTIVGVLRNPIQILTLTYVSDEALPPSDSTIGRAQVDELEAIRDLMMAQRKHSIPVRWYNPTMVGPNAKTILEKGTPQGFVAVFNGDRGIGEIARASFPPENIEFQKVADDSLSEIYQVGTNQAGAFARGERSASEANIIQQNFQTRVGQERDRVTKHFVGIAENLAGHLALYGQFELPAGIPKETVANGFVYSVRVDSTVLLDAQQRIEQLTRALNLTAQSGYVNPKEVIAEIWELSGVDPSKVVVDPQPKPPEPVNLSLKGEDLINPMAVASLMHTQQAPTPEDIAATAKLFAAIGMIPGAAALMAPPVEPAGENGPPREPETPGISNPNWEAAPRVERRAEDGGA